MKRIVIFATLLVGLLALPSCGLASGLGQAVGRSVGNLGGAITR